METKNVNFTQEEAQVLINLINIAVKTTGLEAADAGIHFRNKLMEAFKKEEVKVEETK